MRESSMKNKLSITAQMLVYGSLSRMNTDLNLFRSVAHEKAVVATVMLNYK